MADYAQSHVAKLDGRGVADETPAHLASVTSLATHRHRIATRESNLAALRRWAMRKQGRLVRRLPDTEREERLARLGEHEYWLRALRREVGR